MPFLGADTDHLRTRADAFSSAAGRIEELFVTIATAVHGTDWHGPDAATFETEFNQTWQRAMNTSNQVDGCSRMLTEEADQQDAASHQATAGADSPSAWELFAGVEIRRTAHVPSRSQLWDLIDHVGDLARSRITELLDNPGQLSPGARRALKAIPIIGAVPDAGELAVALTEWNTGGAIGNLHEIALGVTPHPLAGGASLINSVLGEALPGDSTPIERTGDIAAADPWVQIAEMGGGGISELLGHEEGSTEHNMISSASGLGAHILLTASRYG